MARKFTKAQWRAYHSGQGYRIGRENRSIDFKKASNKESFRAGYRSVGKNINRYPKIK